GFDLGILDPLRTRPVHWSAGHNRACRDAAREDIEETLMSTSSKLLLFALAATFVTAEVPTAGAAPRPPLCTAGRFAVSPAPLLGPGGDVVLLDDKKGPIRT